MPRATSGPRRSAPLSRFRPLAAALAAAALIVAACSSGSSAPAASPTPRPTPAPLAAATSTPLPASAPTPTPAPLPTPAATAPPTAAPVAALTVLSPSAVIVPGVAAPEALAGVDLEFRVGGFQPLERVAVTLTGPDQLSRPPFNVRAARSGEARWRRDTTGDAPGTWTVQARGSLGARRDFTYRLTPLALPVSQVASQGATFNLYRTPEATIYFDPAVPSARAALVAQYYREALGAIERDFDFKLAEPIDVFLLPDNASFVREVKAGGAKDVGGFEAGISLYAFPRSGIYIDMSSGPLSGLPHIVAHELVHQVSARIEKNRNSPAWFVEGIAEYEGFKTGLAESGDRERQWRRAVRNVARRAIEGQGWIELATIGDYAAWQGAQSEQRLELMYAQAYVSLDYVGRTFGEASLRPLHERIADSPTDLEGVFRGLFTLPFADYQQRVQEAVRAQDDFERQMKQLVDTGRVLVRMDEDSVDTSRRWNAYVGRRALLTRAQREAALRSFLDEYEGFQARVNVLAPPERAAEVTGVFRDSFAAFVEAVGDFLRFEGTGDPSVLNAGNAALSRANFLIAAGGDLLAQLLKDAGVSASEVGATPAAP